VAFAGDALFEQEAHQYLVAATREQGGFPVKLFMLLDHPTKRGTAGVSLVGEFVAVKRETGLKP
ncbi:hypothetical protein, partial [Klebsiella pneumoniae]|uniref:hypothetical protein n=1 Tax=Klebsiella pneumoniae TaxID=573 RepID=UPI0039E29A73